MLLQAQSSEFHCAPLLHRHSLLWLFPRLLRRKESTCRLISDNVGNHKSNEADTLKWSLVLFCFFFPQLFSLEKQEESSDDETEEGEVEDDNPSDVEVSTEGKWKLLWKFCPGWCEVSQHFRFLFAIHNLIIKINEVGSERECRWW